jgi:drug/metabolite transporter (DMT)-like permease
MISYIVAIACVVGIAIGQILFKVSAVSLKRTGSFFSTSTFTTLASAFALYGVTSLAWIWALQHIELGRAYPLMALAFVLVPLGSHLFLNERFSHQYFVGVAIIIAGIIITVRA